MMRKRRQITIPPPISNVRFQNSLPSVCGGLDLASSVPRIIIRYMAYFLFGFTTPSEVYRKSARTPVLRYTSVSIASDGVCSWHSSTLNKDQTAWQAEGADESLVLPPPLLAKIKALVESNYSGVKNYSEKHKISVEGGFLRRSLVRFLDLDFLVPDYILEYHDYCYLSRYIDFPNQEVVPTYVLLRKIMVLLSGYLFHQEKHPCYIYHAPSPKKSGVSGKGGQ